MAKIKLIFGVLLLLCCSCQTTDSGKAKKKSETLVKTAKATEKDLQSWIEAAGKLAPVATVEMRPRVKGTIQAIFIKEGKNVEEGTPLFKIDPRAYQLKKEELENELEIDRINLSYLEQKQSRLQNITKANLISQEDREDLELDIEKKKSNIANTEIKLRSAQLDYENCLVRAPISGRLGKVNAHVGQWVSEGDKPLTMIDKIDELVVEFTLAEDDLLKLDIRPIPFTVVSLAQEQRFCTGICTFIDHQVDPKTGSIKLEGKISNAAEKFRKNQIIKVLIESKKHKNVVTVPRRAVKMNEDGTYVYLISKDNEAELHPVMVEDELDDLAIIQVGLQGGEEVITEGHLRLYPGAKVKRKVDPL